MLAKISLIILAMLNLYVVISVSKESRRDIGHNIKLIPNRIKRLFSKIKVRQDDDKEIMIPQIEPLAKTVKMDFSENCRKHNIKCGGCDFFINHVKPPKSACMECECSLCIYGVCPPAKRG